MQAETASYTKRFIETNQLKNTPSLNGAFFDTRLKSFNRPLKNYYWLATCYTKVENG